MKVGVVYPQIELGGDPSAVREIAVATEQLGYHHLMAYDHVLGAAHSGRERPLWGPYTERDPFHDPLVMFGHIAALTTTIELVTGVLVLPQRQTALVARQVSDVDLFSGGRLRLGVGTGWNYVEYDALGQVFRNRGARLDEQIPLLRRLWDEPLLSFEGNFDRVDRGGINPRPGRRIPIWVGGFSEPAFRRGAHHGDGFVFGGQVEDCAQAAAEMRQRLNELGRPIEGFGFELVPPYIGSDDELAKTAERWQAAGGTHLSVVTMGRGLDSVAGHLDYIQSCRELLRDVVDAA